MIPLYVYVESLEQFDEALTFTDIDRIYLDCNAIACVWKNNLVNTVILKAHQSQKEIYFGMPHIFRRNTIQMYEEHYQQLFQAGWDGVLIRNYESYQFLRKHEFDHHIVTDYNLYQLNKQAQSFWQDRCIESGTAPLELNERELGQLGLTNMELVVYGYLPMMISAQCIQKNMNVCHHTPGILKITDRYHKDFPVKNLCDYCYNIIYNTAPFMLIDQKPEILKLKPKALRMHFTIENKETTREMLTKYKDVFCHGMQLLNTESAFTRGHFKRGIK